MPLSVTGVTVTSHPVFFQQNSLSNQILWFLILFIFYVPVGHAIDQIEIHAGGLQFDDQHANNVSVHIDLSSDEKIPFTARAEAFNRTLDLSGQLHDKNWQVNTRIQDPPGKLLNDISTVVPLKLDHSLDGDVLIKLRLSGSTDTPEIIRARYGIELTGITGEVPDHLLAFEGMDLHADGDITSRKGIMNGNVDLRYTGGLIAIGDVLLEPLAGNITFTSNFTLGSQSIRLRRLRLSDPGGLTLLAPESTINLDDPLSAHSARIQLSLDNLTHIYKNWLQPLTYGTLFEDLELEGKGELTVDIEDRAINKLGIHLADMTMVDNAERLALYDFSFNLNAEDNLNKGNMQFNWQQAEIFRLLTGQTHASFDIQDQKISIEEPFRIPFYDGELKVFKLSLAGLYEDDPQVEFDGILTPVSLSAISQALQWPALSGSLSGVIPAVRYDKSGLQMDGILLARAFDGTFKIRNLKVGELFSPVPHLNADFSVDNLDLAKLTQTFDFGRIEGKLSGYIGGLQMTAWEATQFDAFFFTPEDDPGPHIISQRAVDNITSLSGSGLGNILSRSYLRVFENFRYDKLGIGCRLRNNVCQMNGIEAASGSAYYIVKSGFLPPRLDIIGYSREVDWPDLLGRLDRVMSDNALLIQ